MIPSPVVSFAQLNDALSRLTALLVMIDANPEINGGPAAQKYIAQAVQSHAELVQSENVIDRIGAFLVTLEREPQS